jgi:hypothetical protein
VKRKSTRDPVLLAIVAVCLALYGCTVWMILNQFNP